MNDDRSNDRQNRRSSDSINAPRRPQGRPANQPTDWRGMPLRKVASTDRGRTSAFGASSRPAPPAEPPMRTTRRQEERQIADARSKRRQAGLEDASKVGLKGLFGASSKPGANKSRAKSSGKNLTPTQKAMRKKKIMRAVAMALVVVLAVTSVVVAVIYKLTLSRLNVLNKDQFTIPPAIADQIQEENLVHAVPYDEMVTNILLLGIDSRRDDINERSDTMIVMSINRRDSSIKMISMQRDMWVPVPGSGHAKINAANAIGGPGLAMETVNRLLRLDIKKFAVVNMGNLKKLVDLLDGVYVDVPNEDVLEATNRVLAAQDQELHNSAPSRRFTKTGRQLANGDQALAFARQRNTGAGDYDRMKRQREVIAAMFSRFKESSVPTMISLVGEGASMISTNLSQTEILGLATTVVPSINNIKQMQIPIEGYNREYLGGSHMGWVNLCNFNGMIPHVQEFLYGKTFPFDRVAVIDGAPESGSAPNDSSPASEDPIPVITEPSLRQVERPTDPPEQAPPKTEEPKPTTVVATTTAKPAPTTPPPTPVVPSPKPTVPTPASPTKPKP